MLCFRQFSWIYKNNKFNKNMKWKATFLHQQKIPKKQLAENFYVHEVTENTDVFLVS